MVTTTKVLRPFQNDSPAGHNIDKLGVYLLVSLFFVVATMIEFAVALLLQRNSRKRKVEFEKSKTKISMQNTSLKRNLSQMEIVPPPTIDALFKSRKEVISQPSECLYFNEQCKNAKFFTSYYNCIDILASVLFPTLYAVFNIVYWHLVL